MNLLKRCVKCGKEFPAVTYAVSKSTYGVGVPESMKDHQNGDLEFFETNKCDACLLEERAKEEEAFENMIEECLKHGCQENCGGKDMFSLWEFDDRTEKHIQNNS